MSEILGKIGFDWHVALANLVNFLIIFFVLKKFAFVPIGKMIKERKQIIQDGLENAKLNAEKMKATVAEYEATIQKARTEANEIFEKGKKEAEFKKAEILAQAQKEMSETIENGKKIIDAERVKMINEAKNEVAGLVLKATEKILASSAGEQSKRKEE